MALLILPAAVTLVFMAQGVIFAWTGNSSVARQTAPVAALLTAGTGLNCIMNIPYALQLAHKWSSLAFWSCMVSVALSAPLLFLLTPRFGGIGAASVWLVTNLSLTAIQVTLMHRRILRTEAIRWCVADLGCPLILCIVVNVAVVEYVSGSTSRFGEACACTGTIGVSTLLLALFTPSARQEILAVFTSAALRFKTGGIVQTAKKS
jgi:O-antigen/teichoic acid export membrane protein